MFENQFEISYTDIKNYGMCPYRLFLKYKLREQDIYPCAPNSRMFLDGWVVHKCIELWNKLGEWNQDWMFNAVVGLQNNKYILTGINANQSNLIHTAINDYASRNNVWFKEGEDSDTVSLNVYAGLQLAQQYIYEQGLNKACVTSELFFKIVLEELNIVAKGYVDLVDQDDELDIYDIKFSRNNYTDWEQLQWYAYMISKRLGRPVRRTYTFNPLNASPFEYCEYTQEEMDQFEETLGNIISSIREQQFEPVCKRKMCYNCLVAHYCEHKV